MATERVLEAAEARSGAMRARGDRPQQRRAAEVSGFGVTSAVRASIEMPMMGDDPGKGTLAFNGYASVVNRGYPMWDAFGEYTETVTPGAFGQSLALGDALDVPLVLGHDSMRRIARTTNGTLRLAEDDNGLMTDADLDPNDADVAYIAPKMRAGLIDEMSFRFTITSGEWSPDWTEYHITGVDLQRGDVSIVGYGANPYTSATVRDAVAKIERGKRLAPDDVRALDETIAALRAVEPDKLREALERAEAADLIDRLESIARAWHRSKGTRPRMTLDDLLAIK